MSDNQDASNSPEYHPAYDDPAADIVLVSQDGQKFRVHSYQLKASSAVFRNTFSLPNPQSSASNGLLPQGPSSEPIQLDISASDLEVFLDLLHNGKATGAVSLDQCGRLIDFANKFEFTAVLRSIASEVVINSKHEPWKAFCLAARLDDPGMAEKLIPELGRNIRARDCCPPYNGTQIYSPLGNFDFSRWEQCPARYTFALMRSMVQAEGKVIHTRDSTYPWWDVGPYFRENLPKNT